jgi:hypothetical protein
MSDKIREALAKLDIDNEGHWTTEGLPRLDIMKEMTGEVVSRSDITMAAKGFSRKTPNLAIEEPENTEDGSSVEGNDTEQTQTAELTEQEDKVDLEGDEAVEAELVAARKNLSEAQSRMNKAIEAMDVVIMRRSKEQNHRTHAETVKEFQRSQQAQRAKAAEQRKLMTEAIASAKERY